jgi:hypothetical protein
MRDLPDLMAQRVGTYQTVGMSGLLGGFQEDRAYLEGIVEQVMPPDHPSRAYVRVMTDTIASNAQWPWAYKCKATQAAAQTLVRVERRRHQAGQRRSGAA